MTQTTGILTIRRPSGLVNALRRFKLVVDDTVIGHIANGETKQIALPAGAHTVQVRFDYFCSTPLAVQLGAGQALQLECGSTAQPAGEAFSLQSLGRQLKSMVAPGDSLYLRPAEEPSAQQALTTQPRANPPSPARAQARASGSLFISYRREDTRAITGRISDRLTGHFGAPAVFRDVDSIPFGVDFREHIRKTIEKSDLVIAVIGPDWLQACDEDGNRRLDNEADFVRLEIESALALDIPVVPVLVDGADMPSAGDLPESLAPLAYRNALFIPREPFFHAGVDKLIEEIGRAQGRAAPPPAAKSRARFCTGCGKPLTGSKFCTGCGRAATSSHLSCA